MHFVLPWYDPSRLTGRKTSSIYDLSLYLCTEQKGGSVGEVCGVRGDCEEGVSSLPSACACGVQGQTWGQWLLIIIIIIIIVIILMKNFNRHSSHGHYGSKRGELAQRAHSRGSHAFTRTLPSTQLQPRGAKRQLGYLVIPTEFGIRFLFYFILSCSFVKQSLWCALLARCIIVCLKQGPTFLRESQLRQLCCLACWLVSSVGRICAEYFTCAFPPLWQVLYYAQARLLQTSPWLVFVSSGRLDT